MWISNNIIILILHISCNAWGTDENCYRTYELPKWEPFVSESEAPAYLRLGEVPEVAAALEAQVENRRENFTLTLLGNPFIKNMDSCLPAASVSSSYHNLRKFHKSYFMNRDGDENESVFFGNIFTGCYYAEMTNAEGKKWLWNPVFFNTSYHYYDTMLKCKKSSIKLEDNELSSQLKLELEVPLKCLQLRCQLFELSKITDKIIGDNRSTEAPASLDCLVENIGNKHLPKVTCRSPLEPNIILGTIPVNEKNEGWSTIITWHFLNEYGASHYAVMIGQSHNTCNISYNDLKTWLPVVKFNGVISAA